MVNFTTDLLDYTFVDKLRAEAQKLSVIQRVTCQKQWAIGELVNEEWRRGGYDGEITKEQFYQECSRAINHGLPFPLVSESGETLRRWCEVTESYAKVPAINEFKEVLSFDHFFQARRMANDPDCNLPAPDIALAMAVKNKWTAGEMVYHFSPKEPVHEYDRVMSWLGSLLNVKLEWIKDGALRKQAMYHLEQFRKIVEAQ